ncbi:MAG: winged helix DNA-binding protein [Gammaproteobacteria bacterium]|nr:winged helix DNA-binding protein [Gammaproteobacteria bacterium]
MDTQKNQTYIPTARLLLDTFRAFENELAQILDSKGFTDVTTGNFNVLRHVNPEGIHLSKLAKDAQISKQAMGKMVGDLELKGYVKLIPDEADARAKYVRFTVKGQKLIDLAIVVIFEMETNYQAILGQKDYNKLRQSVSQICKWHQNKEEK